MKGKRGNVKEQNKKFVTTDFFLSHKANNFLADEDKEPCSSPCASSMAEDSEVDSIPSNECKKVNDLSALGKGTPEFEKCMTPKHYAISPTDFLMPCILWAAVADVDYKRGF